MDAMRATAASNLELLRRNAYLGSMIIIGKNEEGFPTLFSMLQGRGEAGQNLKYVRNCGMIHCQTADPNAESSKDTPPHNVILVGRGYHVVGTGEQTNDAYNGVKSGKPFEDVMKQRWSYGSDAPHFTSRITGLVSLEGDAKFEISVLRKHVADDKCASLHFPYADTQPGYGYGVHAYDGTETNRAILRPWSGRPHLLPLVGSAAEILATYLEAIHPQYVVSMAAKVITERHDPPNVAIYNAYEKVADTV